MSEVRPCDIICGFEFLGPISRGNRNVFLVKSRRLNRFFWAKVTVASGNVEAAWLAFDDEMMRLRQLDHPNIVKVVGHFRRGNSFVVVTERSTTESIHDWMEKSGPMKSSALAPMIRDLISAVRYSWTMGVHHGSISPENLLVSEAGTVQLVWPSTSPCESQVDRVEACFTPGEGMEESEEAADVWALGATITRMCLGSDPANLENVDETRQLLLAAAKGMLVVDPKRRVMPSQEWLKRLAGPKKEAQMKREAMRDSVSMGIRKVVSLSSMSGLRLTEEKKTGIGFEDEMKKEVVVGVKQQSTQRCLRSFIKLGKQSTKGQKRGLTFRLNCQSII